MTLERKFAEKLRPGLTARLNILMASLTGPASSPAFYEKALRKLHNVVTFGPYRDRAFWEEQAASLKEHAFYREGAYEYWLDIMGRLAKPCDIVTEKGLVNLAELKKKLPQDFRPDLFLWVDQHGWNLPVNLEPLNCPTVALLGDTHLHLRNNRELWLSYARTFDFVFLTFNRHHMRDFREGGCPRVFWSPAACDPEVHCKIPAEKIYQVSFVGSTYSGLHQDRIKLLEHLRQNGVDVHIDSKLLHDMSLVFSRSKMVLNRSLAQDLNMRVFETLATGSLLLTNRLDKESGQEELFKDGQHLVLYNDRNILDLVRYYSENHAERERIAAAGYVEVLSKHTYDHRVREVLQVVMEQCAAG